MRPDDPQDLESALAAYRRLPRSEPSAALDAAIRTRARAALATRARPRWPVLFATAATVVLAASLGWRTWRESTEQPAPLVPAEAAGEASSPAGSAPDAKADAGDSSGTAPLQDAGPRAGAPAQAPSAPPVLETLERRDERASGVPVPAAEPLPQAFSGTAAGAARDASAPPSPPPAPPAPAAPAPRSESQAAPTSADAPSSMGSLKKAEAAPIEAEADAMQATAPDRAAHRANAVPAVAAPAGIGAVPATPAAAGTGREPARRQAGSDKQAAEALAPIRELLRQGRRIEARQALERWQLDWPDAVVPEDLRTLLQ